MTASKPADEHYDDVSPITSDSDPEDDPVIRNARDSTEVAAHDQDLLDEEEEREKLLTAGRNGEVRKSFFTRNQGDPKSSKGKRTPRRQGIRSRKRRGKSRRGGNDEEGELMYEMEEGGGGNDDISSQASSSSADRDKLNLQTPSTSRVSSAGVNIEIYTDRSVSQRRRASHCAIITISIVILFCALTFGAYKVSNRNQPLPNLELFSNGTSTFAPTTILISLDGFRADFLHRGITPTLNQFIAEGVSPKYMYPSFPSVTFPNHFTLVTGLHPESHGIVGNTFWDPNMEEEFHNTDPAHSMQPKWWAAGEPLWVTAEKQNVETAVHMWPGSEAGMAYSATYLDKFNGSEIMSKKTDRILELLDLPSIEDTSAFHRRPQLIAAYVPDVDAAGHGDGPNSTEIWDTISNVDAMLHDIFMGLNERNLTNIVNVIVVSDHGMASTSVDRMIQLDDLIDLDLVEHIDGWPLYGLRPKDPIDLRGLYDRLWVEANRSEGFDVYLRDENMPERYHFSNNDRIAPLWVVPKTSWAIVSKKDFDVKMAKANNDPYSPKGLHGYDNQHPLMRAIFVARGPAFPHKPNSRLEVFQNIEVYNILCDSLGIEPKPNNGTLRLPLKPVGLHSDEPNPSDDDVDASLPGADPEVNDEKTVADPPLDQDAPAAEEVASNEDESKEEMNSFWAFMKKKMKAAMEWAHKVIAGLKESSKPPKQDGG